MPTRFVALLVAASWLLPLAGCFSNGLAKVTGKITVAGKPVTSGQVMFYPAGGPGAYGEIKPDGTYTLTTYKPGDGAWIGAHQVAIQSTSIGPSSVIEPKTIADELSDNPAAHGKILVPGKVTWTVPEKYSQPHTSPLTADVLKGKVNRIDFDIPVE